MIHNVGVTIKISLMGLDDKTYHEIFNKFKEQMQKYGNFANDYKLSFEELDKLFFLSDRKYVSTTLDYPNLDRTNENDFSIDTSSIEIIG